VLQDDARQRMLRCSFPPGVGHERHFHVPHVGYTLAAGRMRITDDSGTREIDLAAGASWSSDGVAWHEVLNVGDTTAVYLIVEPR
jgi:quercetin dioxygenase-like cupin family protein